MTVPSKKLYIKTYGCQMNVYDSGRMMDLLKPLGYSLTEDASTADMAILNTCHIREKAEQKVYSELGRLRDHRNERRETGNDMLIAVGGCVGQAEGEEIIRQAPYVDLVFGPQTYHRLPEIIEKARRKRALSGEKTYQRTGVIDTDFPLESKFDLLPATTFSPISAFLSIQEGCDKFCTFCVVPYTRGAEYSRPAKAVLEEARLLVEFGAKEITLLGQNVNGYHGEAPYSNSNAMGPWGLGRLVQELALIPGLIRIRYMTSHPRDMDQDLIDAHRDVPALMPFLHLPVQSGSNKMLEAMNRKHTVSDYLNLIEKLRKARPDIAFSSDFIIGFPGETQADHLATLDLIREVGYAQAYSFKYSMRPGTPAAAMDPQVSEEIKIKNLCEVQDFINQKQLSFNQGKIGTIQSVLIDRQGKQVGQLMGKTEYMQSVPIAASADLLGQLVDVRIETASSNSLAGHIVSRTA
ncbi:MAG: tRNA (N6-isopentenyl adenosine(37)-C2)-methylthiotransferase MiaB [Alphaproteobacteria bacterium]|nr:tRNA (N6-isopentenyl adenosine(37)-C2)-methylthiotransferase MiaB [Alphaproteobacteria bacterium]